LFDAWQEGNLAVAEQGPGAKQELSLVNDEQFEEFLAVTDAVSRLEPRYKEQLYALERRLSALTGTEYTSTNNPLGPTALCRIFYQALHGIDIDPEPQSLMFKKLEMALGPVFGTIYDQSNQTLIQEGIIPQIEYHAQRIAQSSHYRGRKRETTPGGGGPGGGGPGGGAGNAEAALGTADGIAAAELSAQSVLAPLAHEQLLSNLGLPHLATVPRRTLREAFSSAKNVISLGRRLKSLSGIGQEDTVSPASDDLEGVTPAAVLDAVSAIDTQVVESVDFRAIRAALLSQLSKSEPVGEKAVLGSEENDVLEIVSAMFRALVEDGHIVDEVRALFKRLQRQTLKLALQDGSFFEDEEHPATRFLNLMGKLRTARAVVDVVEDSLDPWFTEERIEAVLDRVASGPDARQAYSDALPALEGLVARQDERYRANVERVITACEEQQAFIKSHRRNREAHKESRADGASGEWSMWLDRTKRLQLGDDLLFADSGGQVTKATHIWAGDDHDPLVFVDNKGVTTATLTLQEVAIQMRRGIARIIEDDGMSVVQRALSKILYTLHDRVKHHAFRDADTGLMNRKRFETQLEQAKIEQRNEDRTDVLCHLGLDKFAVVRQAFGAQAATAMVRELADRVQQHLGRRGDVARIAEAEFGVLLYGCSADEANKLFEHQLLVVNHTPFVWQGQKIEVSLSIAAMTLNGPAHGADKLLKVTLDLLEETQKKGGNAFNLLEPNLPAFDTTATDFEGEDTLYLEQLISGGDVMLAHERVFAMDADGEKAVLIDLSLLDPQDDAHTRGELLTRAERIGRRVEFDQKLLDLAFQWMESDIDSLDDIDAVIVPISGGMLKDRDLSGQVAERLMNSEVPPYKICFEVAEGTALERLADVQDFVHTLKEFGCRFCIREFGGTEGSYSYLDELPVDFVKVANLYIEDIRSSESDRTMVESITEIAHFTGKQTIACNVRERDDVDILQNANIDLVKGPAFHTCTPLTTNP
jgi:diguanylate cyclase (GGDEF)-like protein